MSDGKKNGAGGRAGQAAQSGAVDQQRLDQLIRFSDLCTSAKEIAEALDDSFLAYMVSMSIQAARLEMRPKIGFPAKGQISG